MSKVVFFTVFFLVAAGAMVMMVTGTGTEAEAPPTPELSEKQQAMAWAAQQGNVLFLYDVANAEGYALCLGTEYLVSLRAGKRRSIDLTANEMSNLSLCKQNSENTSVYARVRDISGVSPGDYLIWDSTGTLNWSRYTH